MDHEIKKIVEEILASVRRLEARVAKLETSNDGRPQHAEPQKKLSLREFLTEHGPSNGVQRTLAIGYFLENYDGASPFTAADFERGFRAARETVPPNINDKANLCVK